MSARPSPWVRVRAVPVLAVALLGLACAALPAPGPPPTYATDLPPHKRYSGPPRARDRVAVLLVQTNADAAGIQALSVDAIDGEKVDRAVGHAVLPGRHALDLTGRRVLATTWRAYLRDAAARIELDASPGRLYGIQVGDGGESIEIVDLADGSRVAAAKLRDVGPRTSCGLGFELAPLLVLVAAVRRLRSGGAPPRWLTARTRRSFRPACGRGSR